MKNILKNTTNNIKNISKDNLKKVSQAFGLSAMIALNGCSINESEKKQDYPVCEKEYGDKKEKCNEIESKKEKQEKKYKKNLEVLKGNLNKVYDIIEEGKEPEYFLRKFNELKIEDKIEIIRILNKNEKISLRSRDINEKYFVFIMYLIKKNNLNELEGEINLFGNVDLGTLLTYEKYSNKEVNFENLKFSDYFSEVYKYLGELNIEKKYFSDEFLLNVKDKEDIENILRFYPGEIKDLSILSRKILFYDFYKEGKDWDYDIVDKINIIRSMITKEDILDYFQNDFEYYGSASPNKIKYLILNYKHILNDDFLRETFKFGYDFSIDLLKEIARNDKNLLNKTFYSLSKEEQEEIFNYEKELVEKYSNKYETDDKYELNYDEKGEYTYSKIIDTKKIYLD